MYQKKYLKYKQKYLNLKDQIGSSNSVANTPGSFVNTPARIANTPASVANTPASVANTPASIANTPASVANTPVSVANTPASIANTPASVANTPVSISNTPAIIANTPVPLVQRNLFANLSRTLTPVQLFANRLESPSPVRRLFVDDSETPPERRRPVEDDSGTSPRRRVNNIPESPERRRPVVDDSGTPPMRRRRSVVNDSESPPNIRDIYNGPPTPGNDSLAHLNTSINETYSPNTILFPNIPFETQITPNIVDGLFTCVAKFNKFIENLRIKKDIIIPRNNPKLLRLKNYLQINDVLDKGELNSFSLLSQTILSLEQGSFEQSNLINHNFDINFADQVGIDTGGLRREYLDLLSKEVPYIFKKENQTLELNGRLNIEYLLVVLEMIYKTKCSIVSNVNILYLFKHYFIGPNKNIIELIENTKYLSVSFSELLLNFINYNYQKNNLEQIKKSLKVKEYVLAALFLFGSYLNDSMLPPEGSFIYITNLDEASLIDTWSDYNIGPQLTLLLSEMDRTYPSYNLFQLHNHFQYNEHIDSKLLISRINFVNIDNSLKEKFKFIIRNYSAALDAYTGSDPEIIKANADFKIQFGDQQGFLKQLLRYWSGSSYIHTKYTINYNESIDDLFHVHTCFFQIETKVQMDINLYDLVYNLIIRFTTEFNTAG